MANITHKQFIEDEVFHLLAQGLKKIHTEVIQKYTPVNTDLRQYQSWVININIEILDELVKQIHIINQEERDY